MKKMISLLLVLVMVLSMIPMTATALVPPYPIEEFSIDIPAYIGATRLSFDQMRFCAQEYVVDSLGFCAIEGETDIVWTKNSLFGKRMEENETYQKGVVYYANFLVLNTNTYVNTFGYGAGISRQDIAVILHRTIKDTTGTAQFADNGEIADYAKDAVGALSGLKILNGFEDGSFKPNASCTRAQAAVIIYNYLNR